MITAKELAKMLGVSPSAVSIALNGREGVSDETRQRILDEAKRLGYKGMRGPYRKKSASASGMSDGTALLGFSDTAALSGQPDAANILGSGVFGSVPVSRGNIRFVIFVDTGMAVNETSFYSFVLKGIEAHAKELGFNVLVSYFETDKDWGAQFDALSQDVNGIIILATEIRDKHIRKYLEMNRQRSDIPLCLVDNATSMVDVDCIVSDNLRGAYRAVRYLLDKGFDDVGYLRSRTRVDSFDEREAGVRKARLEAGIPQDKELPVTEVASSSEQAYQDMCRWLEEGGKPQKAYFADNDIIAAACVRALKTYGYRVPEDVSIIGFDNMPLCTLFEPPLTTISVEKELIGRLAMHILAERMHAARSLFGEEHASSYLRITSSAKLIERESVI